MSRAIYVRRKGGSTRMVRVEQRRNFKMLRRLALKLVAKGEPHHSIAMRLSISRTYLAKLIEKGIWL